MKLPRWLLVLIAITIVGILVPWLGAFVPALDLLRGFFYARPFLLMAWVIVAFYHALRFLISGR